ncbi:hypothetical protein F4553_000722 [Allocatelliglobosispora scoriae]|uniref:Exo-alpha-sialidase n=1 Tax=Allocatelliglobosispora scoriae TaxID=643052 RepID=A0A841BJZ9_9ACTN|nr:sialidase family protein [Allocatelliglobosispora scoriae]MBB5867343.1 hypothetical protein [Allocatelliglobosispora scoriae]
MRFARMACSLAACVLIGAGLTLAEKPAASQARPMRYEDLSAVQKRIASGALVDRLQGEAGTQRAAVQATQPFQGPAEPRRGALEVRVNQRLQAVADPDLHGRGQAQNEPWLAINPRNRNQIAVAYHDYSGGDANCGISYSSNGGRSWSDAVIPTQFMRGTAFGGKARQYFQAGGDPGLTWDSRGNAYYACGMFNRGPYQTPSDDQSSGVYIFRSTGTGGATWNFAGRPVAEESDVDGQGDAEEDKQLIVADSNVSSPFRDRLYVTWTRFGNDGTAYIYASHSADFGETFSPPVLVSRDSALCTYQHELPAPQGRCNVNQAAQPVVAADGTLNIVYNNYNTPMDGPDNKFQVLASRSTDGGVTFSAPVKVGDYYDLPDCDSYQGEGANPYSDCIPEKGATSNSTFRAANYPLAAADPTNPNRIVVGYGSYISRNSNENSGCVPDGFKVPRDDPGAKYKGVKAGCNNDIVLSTSNDGGRTFDGTTTDVRNLPIVTTAPGQATSDQFWHGIAFSPRGTLVVAYYDRQYDTKGAGYSDITLTEITKNRRRHVRVTSSSMPPPTQFRPAYYGDYIQIDATATTAHPVWSDTRAKAQFPCTNSVVPAVCTARPPNGQTIEYANDQDIVTATVPIS